MKDETKIIEVGDTVKVIDTFVVDLISNETGKHIYENVEDALAVVTEIEPVQQGHSVAHGIIHLRFISTSVAGYEATIPATFLRVVEKGDITKPDTLVVGSHVEFQEDVYVNGYFVVTKGKKAMVKQLFANQCVVMFDEPLGGIIGGMTVELTPGRFKILTDWDPEDSQT